MDRRPAERLQPELRRKAIHLLLLSVIGLGRLLGPGREKWAPTAFLAGALAFEIFRHAPGAPLGWFRSHFGRSLRDHESDGLLGTVPFFATVCPLAWLGPWPRLELVVLVVLIGDAAAALTGRLLHGGEGRTLSGSAAYVLAALLAAVAWGQPPGPAAALGLAASISERLAGALHLDDNWVAPPLTFLVSSLLGLPR
jgi:dolichol kinase